MKFGSGAFIVVVGLLLLYLGITGRYECFVHFLECLFDPSATQQAPAAGTQGSTPPLQQRLQQRFSR